MAGVKFVVIDTRFFRSLREKSDALDKWVEENQGYLSLVVVAVASIIIAGIIVARLAIDNMK